MDIEQFKRLRAGDQLKDDYGNRWTVHKRDSRVVQISLHRLLVEDEPFEFETFEVVHEYRRGGYLTDNSNDTDQP